MGAVISRWMAKPSTVEVLEGIEKDIQILEEYREKYQKQLKVWLGRLLLYSALLYVITCIVVYFWYLPEQFMGRLILSLPFIVFPILVWSLRKLLRNIFSKRTEKNNDKLEDLKAQKRKILEEVMETETYKNAKMILERFDPDAKKKMEVESTLVGPQMTPKPGQELRHRNVIQKTPSVVNPASSSAAAAAAAAARPPLASGPTFPGPASHSAPGGPPERSLSATAAQQSLMRKPVTPGTPVPGVGMHPPGPPLARPVLPRDRGAMDRVIEYLVGDGPQNRYALICQDCLSHNGMALKEEFEYIAFRCAYCFFLNPARKTRPQAPALPMVTGEVKQPPEAPIPTSDPAVKDEEADLEKPILPEEPEESGEVVEPKELEESGELVEPEELEESGELGELVVPDEPEELEELLEELPAEPEAPEPDTPTSESPPTSNGESTLESQEAPLEKSDGEQDLDVSAMEVE